LENKALHSLFGWEREDDMEIITERHSKEIFKKETAVHLVSLPVTKAQIISLATCFQRLRVTDHIQEHRELGFRTFQEYNCTCERHKGKWGNLIDTGPIGPLTRSLGPRCGASGQFHSPANPRG
jgi:hypothetical protein